MKKPSIMLSLLYIIFVLHLQCPPVQLAYSYNTSQSRKAGKRNLQVLLTSTHLLWDWKFRKVWDVSSPLHCAEEKPCSQLTDAVDAHDGGSARWRLHLCLTVWGAVAAVGVRLSPQQLGDEFWHRLPVKIVCPNVTWYWSSNASSHRVWTDTWVRWRDAAPLDCCKKKGGRQLSKNWCW